MKRLQIFGLSLWLAFVPIVICGCGSGCQSNAGKTTYVASGVTHITATTALHAYNEYLGAEDARLKTLAETDKPKADAQRAKLAEQVKKVEAAYGKYQTSQITTLNAAQQLAKLQADDPNGPLFQDQLANAVAQSSVALSALLEVIKAVGVKIK